MTHEKKKICQILKNWKFFSFDRSSIDWIPIEISKFKPKNLTHFRSVEKHIRLVENLENSNFWKTEQFNAETPKAQCFMNEMHEYKIKSFSKTLIFNPDLSKTHYWINLSSKTQTLNTFCIKTKEHITLVGQNIFTHNIMYQV